MTEVDVYEKGTVRLEEWEDVNYCEHSFCVDGECLNDNEVVDLIYKLKEENQKLKNGDAVQEFERRLINLININKELIEDNRKLKEENKKLQRIKLE